MSSKPSLQTLVPANQTILARAGTMPARHGHGEFDRVDVPSTAAPSHSIAAGEAGDEPGPRVLARPLPFQAHLRIGTRTSRSAANHSLRSRLPPNRPWPALL
jgi:hypothetical protein